MTISDYLIETHHAASVLVDAITTEWRAHKQAVIAYNEKVSDFKNFEQKLHERGMDSKDIPEKEGKRVNELGNKEEHLSKKYRLWQ